MGTQTELLAAISAGLSHHRLEEIREAIDRAIDEDLDGTSSGFMAKTNACFAVHTSADPFMKISRDVFRSVTEKVQETVQRYQEVDGVANGEQHRVASPTLRVGMCSLDYMHAALV